MGESLCHLLRIYVLHLLFVDQAEPEEPLYYRYCGGVVHSELPSGTYKMGCVNLTIPFKHDQCFCNCKNCNYFGPDHWNSFHCVKPYIIP